MITIHLVGEGEKQVLPDCWIATLGLFFVSLSLSQIHEPSVKMASATGIPQEHPETIEAREDEPLLGRPGDVTQKPEEGIYRNLFTGEN
jgi:hypothetical protein